ncbi:caspase family protein [uncultured Chitinophaga sp.]|uniref:caspase family protein n=1 Tax=uncultured Chitinophaga sp. TaxID=339340 RepID=UPI0025CD058D|nr:caspase family protein [uncultured Chitinophaga sp.]
MRFDSLPEIEKRFKTEAGPHLKPFSLPVPGEPQLMLNGVLYSPPRTGYYHPTQHPKERIVLHFTAGNTRSDMMSLTQQNRHVSVAFVIARDGTIYQLFPSAGWSGHLGAGVGNQGTGNAEDKATIGIEISNYGYLVPREGQLETIYSRLKNPATGVVSAPDPYCKLSQKEAYTEITTPFRGQTYYANCTPEQVESTVILLRFLTAKYNIPREFLPEAKRFVTTNEVLTFKGIVTHVNYRTSGKWDIGPAFDWNALISGVKAPSFAAKSVQARGLTKALDSEEAIAAEFASTSSVADEMAETTDNEGYNPNDFEDTAVQAKGGGHGGGKLKALLVGINDYQQVNPLSGCVNDVQQMEKYLFNRTAFSPAKEDVRVLKNEQATRANIISGIREFLADAGENDTLLFYYSGHGAQEEADEVWGELDGLLECLVCYDGDSEYMHEFLLTDKELRYLLHELYEKTKAHIVTIFDCCHSGDNTRGALQLAALGSSEAGGKTNGFDAEGAHSRRVSEVGPKREWEHFLFAKEKPYASIKSKKPDTFLPEAPHIQMAGCEDNQLSLEVNRSGVFTKRLIATLDAAGGSLSYNALRDRIRQALRFSFAQTPRVYAAKEAQTLLSKGFLNQPVQMGAFVSEITFNNKTGWQLNLGAIHGLQQDSTIEIIDSESGKKYNGSLQKINVDYSFVEIDGSKQPDDKLAHKAVVRGLMTGQLQLELNNVNGNPGDLSDLLEQLEQKAEGYYDFVSGGKDGENSKSPDYTLHIRGGDAVVTLPGDTYRPLVLPLPAVQKEDNAAIVNLLQHISRWRFLKNLRNPHVPDNFPTSPLDIKVTRINAAGKAEPLKVKSDSVTVSYEQRTAQWKAELEIKITNTQQQDLYVAAVFLTSLFRAEKHMLPGDGVLKIPAGETVSVGFKSRRTVSFTMDDYIREYNWSGTTEHLKFVVSTELFSADALQMEGLQEPYTLKDRTGNSRLRSGTRGLDGPDEPRDLKLEGWTTQHLQIQLLNPLYNTIQASVLKALMEYDETAFYAAGLYYDVTLDKNGQPTELVLKEEITVVLDKGLLANFKIWAGNKVETLQRKKMYRKLKDTGRIRIVAEGDSWFQYPILVQDTLDHLYKVYAIRSFAEAGDTMENYMKDREYLDAIKDEEVDIFLVSGGGNDILGSQFEGFLRDTPEAGEDTPKKYLKPEFFTKLQQLEDWYVEMFRELLIRYPDLHIISQSYDYIIPIDTVQFPKTTSWLGQYMIKKKIEDQAERERVIAFIVDRFNEHLKRALDKFPQNTSYVDARKLVDRDSWFDEIHPTNEGFSLVADKFVDAIRKGRPGATKPPVASNTPVHEPQKP